MTEIKQVENPFNTPAEFNLKPSTGLNVITILSIIGSILGLLQSAFSFFNAQKSYDDLKKLMESGGLENAPGFVKNMVNKDTLIIAEKMLENKVPILVLSILGAALCLYGAIEMRKLKAQGYTMWLIGELLPIATMMIFIGAGAFSGFSLIGYLFPLVFIVLYTVYRKELVN